MSCMRCVRGYAWAVVLSALGFGSVAAAWADEPSLDRQLLLKARPDECYVGLGDPANLYPWEPGEPCSGTPKANSHYVWGMTKAGDDLWLGTGENVYCVLRGIESNLTDPFENDTLVCEFGISQFRPELPDIYGDWRPPHIYVYDTVTDTVTEKTHDMDFSGILLLHRTLGMRSAGTQGNVVMMGGPDLFGGVNLFAFRADTREFIAAKHFRLILNIRSWVEVQGVLYTGVQTAAGGGAVLRWRGNEADPFQFEIVGSFPTQVAYLAEHDGRLCVTTWSHYFLQRMAGLYASPVIPAGGLTRQNADEWRLLWSPDVYDPDPIAVYFEVGGALQSFDGYLFWGTMHSAGVATEGYNIYRAITVYRGRFDAGAAMADEAQPKAYHGVARGDPPFTFELLYGDLNVVCYDLVNERFVLKPNNLGVPGLYGESGITRHSNSYTWQMGVFNNQLFIGTLDFSFLSEIQGILPPPDQITDYWGSDLVRFPSALEPAVPEDTTGLGNYTNYGVRTMVTSPEAMYLGISNVCSLMTDPNDAYPEGGWELIKLTVP